MKRSQLLLCRARAPGLFLVVLLGAAVSWHTGGCVEDDPGVDADADADAGAEAGIDDASVLDAGAEASVPDAWVRPDARVFDFCGESLMKMPFNAMDGYLSEQEIEGMQVYYSFRRLGEGGQIYQFNLDLCQEVNLTPFDRALYFGVGRDLLVFDNYTSYDTNCQDMSLVDLETTAIAPLFSSIGCESRPHTNGRQVAYLYQPDNMSPGEFRLHDLGLGSYVVLSPYTGLKSPRMSDRYVVWTAVDPLPWSEGSDVFVHDIATGDTTRVEASYDKWQDWIFVWEDYVTWSGAEGDLVPPYHLVLYNLVTGEATTLLEGDYAIRTAHIRDGLVTYNTSRYTQTTDLVPSDIEIYDLETGITRRLTAESGYLRAARIDPPYLLMAYAHGAALRYDLYVANLEMMGVVDSSGRLIPGDGVLVLPP